MRGPTIEASFKVFQLVRDGLSNDQIMRWAKGKDEYNGHLNECIHRARETLMNSGRVDPLLESGRAVERLHDLYARLHQVGDFKGCLQVQGQLNKALGLDNPKSNIAIKSTAMSIVDLAAKYIPKGKQAAFLGDVKAFFGKGQVDGR